MHSTRFFRVKPIARLIFKAGNFPEAVQFLTNPTIKYYCTYSIITALPMHSTRFFRVKPIARLIFKAGNFPEAVQFLTNPYY